jgi:ribosomal protein L28
MWMWKECMATGVAPIRGEELSHQGTERRKTH